MRKEKKIVVNDRGRELAFVVREMPATKLESWIVRAGLLIAGAGLADGLLGGKSAGEPLDVAHVMQAAGQMAAQGGDLLRALGTVDYEKARPLLNELLECCTPADAVTPLTPETADGIIEDVRTLFTLRKEALALGCPAWGTTRRPARPRPAAKYQYAHGPDSGRKVGISPRA